MAEIKNGSIFKIYCNSCKGETKHELMAQHSREYDEVEGENTPYPNLVFWEKWTYRFLVCRGCDTATFQIAYTDAAMFDHESGEQVFDVTYHPQRARQIWERKRFRHLDPKLEAIYQEAIACFNTDAKIACAMCIRALLEGICVNKGITDQAAWGLEKKLKKLEEGNHLPSNIVEYLLSFKFIGDDAAHRLVATTRSELEAAISVMEDLLNFLYEVEYELASKAQRLAALRSADMENFRKQKTSGQQSDHKDPKESA